MGKDGDEDEREKPLPDIFTEHQLAVQAEAEDKWEISDIPLSESVDVL